jgi:hypothetical protein
MKFPMYKLIDDIKDYQQKWGREPDMDTIRNWAEKYVEDEKGFYYEKPCSRPLTFILLFSMYLLGVISTLLFLTLL